jgi:CheY-like chemotaxis protein
MDAKQSHAPVGTHVFVVDDEPMLLELAIAVLESVGCEVRTFRDPELALKAFITAPPDVVITDYAMGAMNGMDLIRECRRLNPCQKVVLISGTVDGQVFENSPVKPDRFLAKPYQIEDFTDCVRALLSA